MSKKRVTALLQDAALILLTASALWLLSRTPLFSVGWSDRVQAIFTAGPQAGGQTQETNLTAFIPSFHAVITSEADYGRYGRLYIPAEDALCLQLSPLLRDALGSASEGVRAAEQTLWDALDSPSIYLDLTVRLPVTAVAACLGAESGEADQMVRYLALSAESPGGAMLYLADGEGTVFRYETALPATAVRELTEEFAPNSASFAFESHYATLSPYAVLVTALPAPPVVTGEVPPGCTLDSLLDALDFNTHVMSSYTDPGGAEVVGETPRTLRFAPGGAVSYTGDQTVASPLYRVASAGEEPTAQEILQAAAGVASALTEGAGASPLTLCALEPTATGWRVGFRCQSEGIPVRFADDSRTLAGEEALSVVITGGTVTSFTYRCRLYTPQEEDSLFLPPVQAAALASIYPGADLTVGYIDDGSGSLQAQWLAG